jgi:hypothetical protein
MSKPDAGGCFGLNLAREVLSSNYRFLAFAFIGLTHQIGYRLASYIEDVR